MGFPEDEKSVSSSSPVELYEIVTPTNTYRFTNQNIDYTYLSNVYTAIPSTRTSITSATAEDSDELVVELPTNHPFVLQNTFLVLPGTMTLKLFRVQRVSGVGIILWQGNIVNISAEGNTTRIRVPSQVSDALESSIPSIYFQPQCNHDLGDGGCRVDMELAAFKVTTTATVVAGAQITVASVGGHPVDWFRTGKIIRVVDGEVRMIQQQVGNVLTIMAPFRTLIGGDSVILRAGCAHSILECRDKFDNVQRFGGHPYIKPMYALLELIRAITRG